MDRPLTHASKRLRRLAVTAAFVLAAALYIGLRAPWLGALPTPCGDEGNWTSLGFALLHHQPAVLAPVARFVSLLFARAITLAYRVGGVSFASARSVLVVGLGAAVLGAVAVLRAQRLPRAAAALALLVAVHPWSVLWTRTATVPYALAFGAALLGPLLLLRATRTGRAMPMVLAAQVIAFGVQFTPLALVPALAALPWMFLRPHRALLRRPAPWIAAALASLHAVPVLHGAASVAGQNTLDPTRWVTHLGERVAVFARTVAGGLTGEATLRHFTGWTLGPVAMALVTAAVVALPFVPAGEARSEAASDLRRWARLHLVVALVGLPLILAPGRAWNLPGIDAERYLFVVLAPMVLLLAAYAEHRGRVARAAPWVFAAYLACVPTARAARFFLHGGSVDHGAFTAGGGSGYRGWKVPRERVPLPDLLRREIDARRGARRAQVVVSDYAFHVLPFANACGGAWCFDVGGEPLPPRPGDLHYFVTWSDGVFAPDYGPAWVLARHRALRALMRSPDFTGLRRERVFTQPDGSPLLELWSAERVR